MRDVHLAALFFLLLTLAISIVTFILAHIISLCQTAVQKIKDSPQVQRVCAVFAAVLVAAVLRIIWRHRKLQQRLQAESEELLRHRLAQQAHFDALAHSMSERSYDEAELAAYNGTDTDKPILLGCDGSVFNVSEGYSFYGAGGCYQALAGRDASRLLAKGVLEENPEEAEAPLTVSEQHVLADWRQHYLQKYVFLGALTTSGRPLAHTSSAQL
mmetsp:Transcript_72177/g.120195  ORF Transcript_72177/g.120195 Transcript_72177/m.120195 type:complete len:214 (+) Transcript_72177:173-814(+)|eukprot:CAMPEP_0119304950 /NCGR_PEP_ID=MMETSP1333-20130426/6057_1 /TAXON_ID=418940 /ORGANISM="Scyphosphaera apsteinii, Strain RCC1455" /LENGTH=213 /DNA_ID=CAMNT_0007307929 /DNA_START=170 /DNA_END=814 /DNA_ORIENTATION=+